MLNTLAYLLVSLILVSPQVLLAEIDPASGEYSAMSVDFVIPLPSMTLELRRFYRSGSSHRGVFGKSWCSFLDDRLVIETEQMTYSFCGSGKAVKMKKANKNVFQAESGARTKVATKGSVFILTDGTQFTKTFDKNGSLIKISNTQGDWIRVLRNEKAQPVSLSTSKLDRILLDLTADGKLRQLQAKDTGTIKFTYKAGRLQGVEKGVEKTAYKYDPKGRLLLAQESGQSQKVSYDKKGRANRVQRQGCSESLTYTKSELALTTKVSLFCKKKSYGEKTYITRFDRSGEKILSQTQISKNSRRDVFLHPKLGLPQLVKSSEGEDRVYEYDKNGRLVKEIVGKVARTYSYDASGFLKKYLISDGDWKSETLYAFRADGQIDGIKTKNESWDFKYSPSGLLDEIRSSQELLKYKSSKNGPVVLFRNAISQNGFVQERSFKSSGAVTESAHAQLQILHLTSPLQRLSDFYSGIY